MITIKSIKVGIQLPTSAEINKDLDKLTKNGYQLKLDGAPFTKTLNDLEAQVEGLMKRSQVFKINADGTQQLTRDIETTKDELGNIVKTISVVDKETGKLRQTTEVVTSEVEKQRKAYAKLAADKAIAQDKMSALYNSGNIDTSQLVNLQKSLDKINTDNAQSEFKLLNAEMKRFEKQGEAYKKLAADKAIAQNKIYALYNTGNIDMSQLMNVQKSLDKINTNNAQNEFKLLNAEIKRLSGEDKNIQKDIDARMKLEQNYNDMWLRLLKDREIKEAQSAQKATESRLKAEQNYNNMWEKLLYDKRVKDEKVTQDQINNLNKIKNASNDILNKSLDFRSVAGLDTSVIDDLRAKLNSLNTNTAEDEMKELQQAIMNLSSADGQIVKLQSTITRMGMNLDSMKDKFGSALGGDKTNAELQTYMNNLRNLEALLQQTLGGKNINPKTLQKAYADMDIANRNLGNSLKVATKNQISFGNAIQNSLAKVGIYTSLAMTMRQLFRVFKDGVSHVQELDKAFFNISSTMNMTKAQFDDVVTEAQKMAKSLGTTTKSVMDIVQVYSNASTDLSTVMEKVQGSAVLGNITGLDTKTITASVQSTINAFQMLEDGEATATDSVNRISDSIVEVSRNMAYDFGDGVQQIIEGIKEAGSVMNQAGMSFESYTAKLGAMIEATGKTGSELANGMKMITARVHGIKELGDELGIADTEFRVAGAALQQFDIAVQDSEGNLRSIDDILGDVSKKWGALTNTEQSYLAESIAG